MAAYDYLFKVLLIGDSRTGKSSLLLRFADGFFQPACIATIGVDFKIRTMEMAQKRIKLQIWDTAGQERFRTITSSYYRGAHGILVCFDVTSKESFARVEHWLCEIKRFATEEVRLLLVGNKCDILSERAVSREELNVFANASGLDCLETSAKTGEGVEAAFRALAEDVLDRAAPDALPKKILTVRWRASGAGHAVSCTNLAGEEVAELMLEEGMTLLSFMVLLSRRLETPKWKFLLVLPTGECLSREQHQASLTTLLGIDVQSLRRAQIKSVFEAWDPEGSGMILEAKLLQIFGSLAPSELSVPAQLSAALRANSLVRGGYVDYNEFIAWLFK